MVNYLNAGTSLEDLAIMHANMSIGWSPGISFTSDIEVARELAKRLGTDYGTSGVVVSAELKRDKLYSIVELAEKGKKPHLPGGEEQILREKEYVYFGPKIPASQVKIVSQ